MLKAEIRSSWKSSNLNTESMMVQERSSRFAFLPSAIWPEHESHVAHLVLVCVNK